MTSAGLASIRLFSLAVNIPGEPTLNGGGGGWPPFDTVNQVQACIQRLVLFADSVAALDQAQFYGASG